MTHPHRTPVAQNGILGPQNPKSVTSGSVTWQCLTYLHYSLSNSRANGSLILRPGTTPEFQSHSQIHSNHPNSGRMGMAMFKRKFARTIPENLRAPHMKMWGFEAKRARKFTRTSPRTLPWNFITMLSAPLIRYGQSRACSWNPSHLESCPTTC